MPADDSAADADAATADDREPTEAALADLRDALAALHDVPVAGLDHEKAGTVIEAIDDIEGLERALANEVEQLRDDGGDPVDDVAAPGRSAYEQRQEDDD